MAEQSNKKRKEIESMTSVIDADIDRVQDRIVRLRQLKNILVEDIKQLQDRRQQVLEQLLDVEVKSKEPSKFKVEKFIVDHIFWTRSVQDKCSVSKRGTWFEISYVPDYNPLIVCRRAYGNGELASQSVHHPGDIDSTGNIYDTSSCSYADDFARAVFARIKTHQSVMANIALLDQKIRDVQEVLKS